MKRLEIRSRTDRPSFTERPLWRDLRWALSVLLGALLAYVVFAIHEPSLLLGVAIGTAVVVIIGTVLRFVTRRFDR